MNNRSALIAEVCHSIAGPNRQGFVGHGEKLAWLCLAIAEGAKLELECDSSFLRLLRRTFDGTHQVWQYAVIEKTVCCSACAGDIPVYDAVCGQGEHGMMWVHPGSCPLMPRVENALDTIRSAWESNPMYPIGIETAEKKFGIDAVNYLIDNGYVSPIEAGHGPYVGGVLLPTRKLLE